MSIDLDHYRDGFTKAGPQLRDTLEASFSEAAQVMSPRGLGNYLEGGKALYDLGRGEGLVLSYLQAIPAVAKEVGEDVIQDCVAEAMKLASLVSGEIIGLLLDTLPTAARRLGDAELLGDYLGLIHQIAAKAPRGLRPMLARLEELFAKLTLGGLRRWALWGAQAHGRDPKALAAYFGLESADSQAKLQQERRGTLFVDNQRKLYFYLRALWGRDFYLRPTSGDFETRQGYKPYIDQRVIHIPDAFDDFAGIPGKELYRAACAHAAAHLMYTKAPLLGEAFTPVQRLVIGLFEDARIERMAIQDFPGVNSLWLGFHERGPDVSCAVDPVVDLLERTAHALLDEDYRDAESWVLEAASAFRARFAETPDDIRISQDLGLAFFDELDQRQTIPSLRALESMAIPYRDDNRFIWVSDEAEWQTAEYVPTSQRQVRKTVSVMEMVNEIDCELAGDDAQEIWTLESEFFRDGDPEGISINQLEGREPVSAPYHYPEWDYQVQLHHPDWVTVLEKRQPKGDPARIDQILLEHRPLASRIRHIIDALQPQGIIRQRHQEDGDEIDINAAVRALLDLRLGQSPDLRINTRYIRKTRDLAVLVLLDLSESTNEKLPGSDRTVLQLALEATALLGWAIDGIGDPFAIHGFASDGRHDLQYYRFKDFDEPYDDKAKARLAGMRGGLSTRMGGALRHAGRFLSGLPQRRKLVLLISDGEPADIDVRDPQYLRHDTRKAVEELASRGVTSYCLTLDANADDYVSRIFGSNRYTVVDRVQKLPEKLPLLFAGLTR